MTLELEQYKLNEMFKGWFVGDFDPSIIKSKHFEVGVKFYKKDEFESRHIHKIATEITVIITGKVRMNSTVYQAGDIILIHPGKSTNFLALEDTTTVVVKTPSVSNDKFPKINK